MKYEIGFWCPDCLERIRLISKSEESAYRVCMGNADLIHISCSKCGLGFYILEEDYDRMKKENEVK